MCAYRIYTTSPTGLFNRDKLLHGGFRTSKDQRHQVNLPECNSPSALQAKNKFHAACEVCLKRLAYCQTTRYFGSTSALHWNILEYQAHPAARPAGMQGPVLAQGAACANSALQQVTKATVNWIGEATVIIS